MVPAEATCVLQCAGNGRGLYTPTLPGVQWRYGAVGNARWVGVRVKDVLERAGGIKPESKRLHLFGSSWGGMLAMQYVLDRQRDQPELDSLILCGSPASMIRWVSDCAALLAEETEETRRVIREHEAAGFTGCPEYQAAILGFYRKHVCRLDPWPAGLERSFAEAGYDVYNTMNGPSEFTVTGTLKTWDIMDRLPEIGVRTLLVGGRYDECTPGHLEEMHRRIAGSQLVIIEDASHLCFAEQPEEFNRVINSFMT